MTRMIQHTITLRGGGCKLRQQLARRGRGPNFVAAMRGQRLLPAQCQHRPSITTRHTTKWLAYWREGTARSCRCLHLRLYARRTFHSSAFHTPPPSPSLWREIPPATRSSTHCAVGWRGVADTVTSWCPPPPPAPARTTATCKRHRNRPAKSALTPPHDRAAATHTNTHRAHT